MASNATTLMKAGDGPERAITGRTSSAAGLSRSISAGSWYIELSCMSASPWARRSGARIVPKFDLTRHERCVELRRDANPIKIDDPPPQSFGILHEVGSVGKAFQHRGECRRELPGVHPCADDGD